MKYKVVQCPRCGHYKITEAEKEFVCRKCGFRGTMKYLEIYDKIIYESDSWIDATLYLQDIEDRLHVKVRMITLNNVKKLERRLG